MQGIWDHDVGTQLAPVMSSGLRREDIENHPSFYSSRTDTAKRRQRRLQAVGPLECPNLSCNFDENEDPEPQAP